MNNRYLHWRKSFAFALNVLTVGVSLLIVLAACGSAASTSTTATTATGNDPAVAEAKAFVTKATAPATTWDGPTTGSKAQKGKLLVYVSSNQQNGGVLGVSKGV